MMMDGAVYTFGAFRLDPQRAILLEDGIPVPIGTRAFVLLETLLRAEGHAVSKDTLMDAAWPHLSVEESNLSVQIAKLRRCLGTTPGGWEWIATVPRLGYRFVSPVAAASRPEATTAASKPALAVLAFTNMSSDHEQDFFADGLAEDLISDLRSRRTA